MDEISQLLKSDVGIEEHISRDGDAPMLFNQFRETNSGQRLVLESSGVMRITRRKNRLNFIITQPFLVGQSRSFENR